MVEPPGNKGDHAIRETMREGRDPLREGLFVFPDTEFAGMRQWEMLSVSAQSGWFSLWSTQPSRGVSVEGKKDLSIRGGSGDGHGVATGWWDGSAGLSGCGSGDLREGVEGTRAPDPAPAAQVTFLIPPT